MKAQKTLNVGDLIGDPLVGHGGRVMALSYSPDGTKFISGSSDRTLIIWDAETGEPIGKPLVGHTSWVDTLAYSPDGGGIY